jgi:hypothetical protein
MNEFMLYHTPYHNAATMMQPLFVAHFKKGNKCDLGAIYIFGPVALPLALHPPALSAPI